MAADIDHDDEKKDGGDILLSFISDWWLREWQGFLLDQLVDWEVEEDDGGERDQTYQDRTDVRNLEIKCLQMNILANSFTFI